MKTAIELIADERQRQIEVEGWNHDHDDAYKNEELSQAAACYVTPAKDRLFSHAMAPNKPVHLWPWPPEWWKPTPDDRIRELVKAGALIIAEIERLQRL